MTTSAPPIDAAQAQDALALDLDHELRSRFGFDAFRPGQREAITALLDGHDLLVVQPTGHGKSLLYQLPAALQDGITLVVSPLLALMRDQLGHLESRFGIPAGSIDSDQAPAENNRVRKRAAAGELKVLFVSPEQLDNVARLRFLTDLRPALLVVDEAHCISTWGHDFRPAYREIARLVQTLRAAGTARVLALTATADARTQADIEAQLAPVEVHRRTMDRPNIALSVHAVRGLGQKLALLDRIVSSRAGLGPDAATGCGLLYCATRENTEVVAEYLARAGHRVAAYHAGMAPDRKRELQRAFLAGEFAAIAATNALGMGIDKSDLRYVVHVDVPGSITAYYQEVGRGGRDGAPARGILLFDPEDLRIQEYFINSAKPAIKDFERVLATVADGPRKITDIRRFSGLHPTRVTVVVAELVEQGRLVKQMEGRTQHYASAGGDKPLDLSRYATQEQVRRTGLDRMATYASGKTGCLMETLRSALGDDEANACGRCSGCTGPVEFPPPPVAAAAPGSSAPRASGTGEGRASQHAGEGSDAAADWLSSRPVAVPGFVRHKLEEGRALFDSGRRSREFVQFMRTRTTDPPGEDVLSRLAELAQSFGSIVGVVPVPSRSWKGREVAARCVADALCTEVYDILDWGVEPEHRQGQLLNNDQRRANVDQSMVAAGRLPSGRVLLLDDYTGSGWTLREAARVLRRQAGHKGDVLPLTIARVRWRLGRTGIV